MSAEAASAKAASAEATSVQSSARRDGTLHPEYPAPRVQSSAPRDGGAGLTAAGTTGQGGATGHGSGVQGTARSSGMPARPSFRESDRAGTLTIQLEARLVPRKFETIAKGKLVPLTLLRPKDTVGAGQTAGTVGLRCKMWDGTEDEDLDNVLWHDWEREGGGGATADEPQQQANAVLAGLPPLSPALGAGRSMTRGVPAEAGRASLVHGYLPPVQLQAQRSATVLPAMGSPPAT